MLININERLIADSLPAYKRHAAEQQPGEKHPVHLVSASQSSLSALLLFADKSREKWGEEKRRKKKGEKKKLNKN